MSNKPDLEEIKKLHSVAEDIVRLLDKGASEYSRLTSESAKERKRKTIHILNQALEYTELKLQKEWGV